MLVLSRKKNQRIVFPNLGIQVEILRVAGNTVSLGVKAPESVQILRGELSSFHNTDGAAAESPHTRELIHKIRNQLHRAQLTISLAQKQLERGLATDAENTLRDMLHRLSNLDREVTLNLPEAPSQTTSSAKITAGRKHALLVEDDENERTLLAAYLRMCGFQVSEAVDGLDALGLMAEQTFDLVVLDMRMPRMNGMETLRAMRQQRSLERTKVVVVSGEDRDEVALDDRAAVSQWFSKPLNPEHLVHHLEEAMA